VLLLSNPSSFFASGNGNLISGGGSALSVASLTRRLNRSSVTNSSMANRLPSAPLDVARWHQPGSPVQPTVQPIPDVGNDDCGYSEVRQQPVRGPLHAALHRLPQQHQHHRPGWSDPQRPVHYPVVLLFANPNAPQGSALVIGFLDGRETPYFDEAATEFSVPGGIQMRASPRPYFDF
jgi:hypothetical protein